MTPVCESSLKKAQIGERAETILLLASGATVKAIAEHRVCLETDALQFKKSAMLNPSNMPGAT
jgi:hypothetical protein